MASEETITTEAAVAVTTKVATSASKTTSGRPRRAGNARKRTTTTAPRKRTSTGRVQERIMAYGLVQVGPKGASLTHVYERKHWTLTRCGLSLDTRGEEVRDVTFNDYSEAECQSCVEMFGVSRLWQIYPPMNLGEHLWDERGKRR